MSTLATFNRQLDAFGKKVEQSALDRFRAMITALADELVNRTPIDTSRARTNWQSTVGVPASAEVPFVEGSYGSTAAQARKIAMASAAAAAQSVRLGNKAYLTNCVPYIRTLNGGSSSQAPRNFVDHAVDAAKLRAGSES